MPIQRPSLQRTLIQIELNRFYEKPVTRISAALILSLLSIGFFAFAAIRPTLQTMAELLKQIEEKKTLNTQLSTKINALGIAQSNLVAKEPLFGALDVAIPASPDFTTLMAVVEKVASENQVTFDSSQTEKVPLEVKTSTSTAAQTLVSYPINLSFSGKYENLIALMREIQSLKRVIVIDRFDISADQSSSEKTGDLSLRLSVRAFSFQPGAGAAAPTK